MQTFRLHLLRHGQNEANVTRQFSYRKVDQSLTDLGREQARHTTHYFRTRRPDVVFCSPLKRAIETARPIAKLINREPVVLEGFRELNPGELEDAEPTDANWKIYDDVLAAWMANDHTRRFPGGEDFRELTRRVGKALRIVAGFDGGPNRVVVAHGGTLLAALHILCPTEDAAAWWAKGIPNCSITEFEVTCTPDGFTSTLLRWADNTHIPESKPGWS